jgi:hypothetical protein
MMVSGLGAGLVREVQEALAQIGSLAHKYGCETIEKWAAMMLLLALCEPVQALLKKSLYPESDSPLDGRGPWSAATNITYIPLSRDRLILRYISASQQVYDIDVNDKWLQA